MRQQPHFIHAQHVLHFRNPKGRIKEGTTVEASFISYVSGIILSIFLIITIYNHSHFYLYLHISMILH